MAIKEDGSKIGTRAYSAGQRLDIGGSQDESTAIVAHEVLLHATAKCFVQEAETPSVDATTCIPLEAGEKFHMRIHTGNKIGVLGDGGSGYLYVLPVI